MALTTVIVGVGPPASAATRPSVNKVEPSRGSTFGGTAVTITGTGFAGATKVRFGTVDAASFRVVKDNTVTAVSPPHAPGTVHVTVTTVDAGADQTSERVDAALFSYFEGAGWAPAEPLPNGHSHHTATLMADGKVIVVGGHLDIANAEVKERHVALYDPSGPPNGGEGAWTVLPGFNVRVGHTATLLADGRVLVAGGFEYATAPNQLSPTGQLYDPATKQWKSTGAMSVPRTNHTATLLPGGRVLVAGGQDQAGYPLASSEILDPSTGAWSQADLLGSTRSTDGTTTADSPTFTSASASFTAADVAREIVGTHIPAGTRIASVESPTSVTLSANATGAGSGLQFTVAAGRFEHTAASIAGGRVLVTGGYDASGEPLASAEVYDPAAPHPDGGGRVGAWRRTSPMAHARAGHTTTALKDGRALVAGGGSASAEVYDPADGSGTGGWRAAGAMGGNRRFHTAALLESGRVLVAGGESPGPLSSAEVYDPATNSWSATGSMAIARRFHAATPLKDGRVLVTGGYVDGRRLTSAELYDPSSTRATPTVTNVEPRTGPTLGGTDVTITGSALFGSPTEVVFGEIPGTVRYVDDTKVVATSPPQARGTVDITVKTPAGTSSASPASYFVYAAGNWATGPSLAKGRSGSIAVTLDDGSVLVAGGDGEGSAEIYKPDGRWQTTGRMTTERAAGVVRYSVRPLFTATRLQSGKILVVGGASGAPDTGEFCPCALNSAEIFDPASGTWTPTAPMGTRRMAHVAALLADGRVLVAGGTADRDTNRVHSSAEIYDPVADTWAAIPNMGTSRLAATATLLPNGKVLVAAGGGHRGACETTCAERPLSSAELYDPKMDSWSDTGDVSEARLGATATLLTTRCGDHCGMVLLAGGIVNVPDTVTVTSDLYDPATGTWTRTLSLNTPRARHTATALKNGEVLVTGGTGAGASAELFDPVSAQWTPTTSMAVPRIAHAAAMVGGAACDEAAPPPFCGKVLAVGGSDYIDELTVPRLSSAELYTQAPDITGIDPDAGPAAGGTQVKIAGAGFTSDVALKFGDKALGSGDFTVASPSEIIARSPAHTEGTVVVTATNVGGTSALRPPSDAHRFTFGPAPGVVSDLRAEATSPQEIRLTFSAPAASIKATPPPATDYVVKQAKAPITDEAAFSSATALCGGTCTLGPPAVGAQLSVVVKPLEADTTYHYALKAVTEGGALGPLSNPAQAKTAACSPATAGAGAMSYPRGYSLVGLPGETRLTASGSPLYGWWDQGAGGTYSSQEANTPVGSGRGYWAWFACPSVVTMSGAGTSSTSAPLGAYRASMVGNPSGTGPSTVSGHDYVARWDPALNGGDGGYQVSGYREAQPLPVGEGLWVFSFVDTTIAIVS
ncbi:MAG: kelch repeat-containing protein [Acidimicrobiales bacterium]|nr:IPT/TIG domain-containing protein [Chloroflexota bacterium]